MQALRNATLLARLVLAWFAFAVAAASAAPALQAGSAELVCSGGAMKLVVQVDGGAGDETLSLHCPLCLLHDAPPLPSATALAFTQPLGHAVQPIPSARIAALTAAPLPARGPPASL